MRLNFSLKRRAQNETRFFVFEGTRSKTGKGICLEKVKPPQTGNAKTPPLNRPSIYKPPGVCIWKITLKYKVKQSKNGKFAFNYKASLIDLETQISLRR